MWFPYLSADRTERWGSADATQAEVPLVLVEKAQGALRIAAMNPIAAQAALRPGMALAEARALLTRLRVEEMDRAADHALLLELATACERFTPLVALRDGDGLLLDITGCTHLFGGEGALMGQARRVLRRLGVSSRAALAGTPDAAWAFAR
ncbi:MAG TPA: DNA polymerase Y family protein, partial [Beijerinckiaceae bacterium]|nr:DNA polymerase Y family protein [Beijerinckiaceae bacterium]